MRRWQVPGALGTALLVSIVALLTLPNPGGWGGQTVTSSPTVAGSHGAATILAKGRLAGCAGPSCTVPGDRSTHAPTPALSASFGWFNVSGGLRFSPPASAGARIAYDPIDNFLVLFGGCGRSVCPGPSQTWVYAGGAWTNITSESAQPPARSGAALAFDDLDGYLLMFGGVSTSGRLLNDTWSFLGGTWTNRTNGTSPSSRRDAGLISDHADGEMILFGGCAQSCPASDTWKYAGGAWTNITPAVKAPPPARWGAAFTYDAADQYGLLSGGCGTMCPLNDSWTFAKNRWSPVSGMLPPKRFGASLSYQAGPNATFLFGGNSSTHSLSDTWKFLAGKWTNVTASLGPGPGPRSGAAFLATTDSWTGSGATFPFAVLYGGTANGCLDCPATADNDTWVLEENLSSLATALPVVVELGQAVDFSASVAGGTAPFRYFWRFGDGGTAITTSASHTFAQSGLYGPTVTVTDWAGVSSRSAVLVSVVQGPTVAADASPSAVDVGQSVTFAGSAAGGSPPYQYAWSFGDGSSGTTANDLHAYAQSGSYPATLTVTDSVFGFGVWQGTIEVNPPLQVAAEASATAVVIGTTVTLSATPLGGTAPYVVTWSMGDGASASGAVVAHGFNRTGTFDVVVTVADQTGATTSQSITVVVSPPAATSTTNGGPPDGWYPWGLLLGGMVIVGIAVAFVAIRRRRRQRRNPVGPIAAAGLRDEGWDEAGRDGRLSPRRYDGHQRR